MPTQDCSELKPCVWGHCPNAPWTLVAWDCAYCTGQPVPCPPPSGEELLPNTPLPLPWCSSLPFPRALSLSQRAELSAAPPHPVRSYKLPWGLPSAFSKLEGLRRFFLRTAQKRVFQSLPVLVKSVWVKVKFCPQILVEKLLLNLKEILFKIHNMHIFTYIYYSPNLSV